MSISDPFARKKPNTVIGKINRKCTAPIYTMARSESNPKTTSADLPRNSKGPTAPGDDGIEVARFATAVTNNIKANNCTPLKNSFNPKAYAIIVYIIASDSQTGNESKNPNETLRKLVKTHRPSRKLVNNRSIKLRSFSGAQVNIRTTNRINNTGAFAAIANIKQIPTNAIGTAKTNARTSIFNVGLSSVYISSDGNTTIATNINSNKHRPSKILSTTRVASVPPNLISDAHDRYRARTISPNRIGNTLLDMYPIITTLSSKGNDGAPRERSRNFQRIDLKTIDKE
jgi:hypothetical protein